MFSRKKMIPNCRGCDWEFRRAYESQENEGLHLATMKNDISENIGKRGHFGLILVDDDGRVVES